MPAHDLLSSIFRTQFKSGITAPIVTAGNGLLFFQKGIALSPGLCPGQNAALNRR